MQGKTAIRKCEANGSHVDNVERAANCDIYKLSVSVHFVPECQATQTSTVAAGQVMSERNASLLFTGELDNGHFDALLPVERNER
jgi:hypothetical protein